MKDKIIITVSVPTKMRKHDCGISSCENLVDEVKRIINASPDERVPGMYAVTCPEHGKTFLTKNEHSSQLSQNDWSCPLCGKPSEWDAANYEAFTSD